MAHYLKLQAEDFILPLHPTGHARMSHNSNNFTIHTTQSSH